VLGVALFKVDDKIMHGMELGTVVGKSAQAREEDYMTSFIFSVHGFDNVFISARSRQHRAIGCLSQGVFAALGRRALRRILFQTRFGINKTCLSAFPEKRWLGSPQPTRWTGTLLAPQESILSQKDAKLSLRGVHHWRSLVSHLSVSALHY